MRGVVPAGMVSGLEEMGLRDCFDSVYGSSAGAISGAYFVTRQARVGTRIFYEYINNKKFINYINLFTKKPVVDLDFLLEIVCKKHVPLDCAALIDSDLPIYICTSSIAENRSVATCKFEKEQDIFDTLKASANVPYFAGPPIQINNELFTDASLYESIPYRSALNGGATDLVILLSRPAGNTRSAPNFIDKFVVAKQLEKYSKKLSEDYLKRSDYYLNEINEIENLCSTEMTDRTIVVQQNSTDQKISSLEKNRAKLVRGAADGFEAAYRSIKGENRSAIEVLSTEMYLQKTEI